VWGIGINGLLTAFWVWMLWRHFHPPRYKAMGWPFWHLYWIAVLGSVVLTGWVMLAKGHIWAVK